jgi:hypothetical protein
MSPVAGACRNAKPDKPALIAAGAVDTDVDPAEDGPTQRVTKSSEPDWVNFTTIRQFTPGSKSELKTVADSPVFEIPRRNFPAGVPAGRREKMRPS